MQKHKKKIQKFIAPKLMIVETSGWRHLKEKNKLFLSYEYQKSIIPPGKWLNFLKLPQTKNGKLYFSPTFQKVELRNSTFFQLFWYDTMDNSKRLERFALEERERIEWKRGNGVGGFVTRPYTFPPQSQLGGQSPSLANVEWPILGPLPFFFYQKSFIFHFLENCFWEPNLYIAVG